jgi:hypothetical protein
MHSNSIGKVSIGQIRRWLLKYSSDVYPVVIIGFDEMYIENGDGVNGPKLQKIVRVMQCGSIENYELEVIELHTEEIK